MIFKAIGEKNRFSLILKGLKLQNDAFYVKGISDVRGSECMGGLSTGLGWAAAHGPPTEGASIFFFFFFLGPPLMMTLQSDSSENNV